MPTRFTLFESYFDSVEDLDDSTVAEYFRVICRYSLRDEEPEDMSPMVKALFLLMKPNLDKSKARFHAGTKGGKQTSSKREAKHKQTESKREKAVSDKDKDKDKDNDKEVKKQTVREKIDQLKPDCFSKDQWQELYSHRGRVKATQTERAYKSIVKEFDKAIMAGMTPEGILDEMSSGKGWAGFKYEWTAHAKQGQVVNGTAQQIKMTPRQQYMHDLGNTLTAIREIENGSTEPGHGEDGIIEISGPLS